MTIPALDFRLFGSGNGLVAPAWSQAFYWLVDPSTKRGDFYTFSAGFGSQLISFQWTTPKPQERRVLAGMTFSPFYASRTHGRVRVSWSVNINRPLEPSDFDEMRARLTDPVSDMHPWTPKTLKDE
jgi:hypothetical protein